MHSGTSTISQARACEAIEKTAFDFTAKFYAAYELSCIARQKSDAISPRAIDALKGLLLGSTFDGQRQRLFLFREAANVLAVIVQLGRDQPLAQHAYAALQTVLRHAHGHAHLAAAEALGALPLKIRGRGPASSKDQAIPTLSWKAWLQEHHIGGDTLFKVKGRSLTAVLPNRMRMVVKLARKPGDGPALRREVQWMQYLASMPVKHNIRFDVPAALSGRGMPLFRLAGLPQTMIPCGLVDPVPQAIAFVAPREYFQYPNSSEPGEFLSPRAFLEVMGRNAFLLGDLAGRGIVHGAPIALFHNRIQQGRRRDGGIYEWFRAGRLDSWLGSCAYPNFGISGLRDFEHFTSFEGKGAALYRQLGTHLISLLLVAGSYFRAKDPELVGWDTTGCPVDTRHLFDEKLLGALVTTIFDRYHSGFTGEPLKAPLPFDVPRLVRRMVAEMGVDHHMEEYLRVVDQQQMTPAEFEAFLRQRGYTDASLAGLRQGARDLVILTGPHLGAFNRGISLPELIEAAAAMAAVCVAQRFFQFESD